MKNEIWSGRSSEVSNELLKEFNTSLDIDRTLYVEDIQGSIAHAAMLENCGILKKDELEAIVKGLEQVRIEIEQNRFVFNIKDGDIHMAIEKRLSELIGSEAGGRPHTARSRNDQAATDFKLFTRKSHLELIMLLKELIQTLLSHARAHKRTIIPSFTHLQYAQPISFSFHILSYVFMFTRGIKRLRDSLELADFSPLGSYACTGTSCATNRNLSAQILGFKDTIPNVMDGVSDRDFALDLLYDIAVIFTHTSRLCEEMILFSASESGFLTISDSFSTGSSTMPQKKNPDVCELMRGRAGRVHGDLISLLTIMKVLSLAYNKDMQEDKEGLFGSVRTAKDSLIILNAILKEVKINEENMLKSCKKGHLLTTDLADYLVRKKNIPFRKAHFIAGNVIAQAEKQGIDISDIGDLSKIDPISNEKAMKLPDFENSLSFKQGEGSSSVASVEKQIQILERFFECLG